MLDQLAQLNSMNFQEFGDPEIEAKVQQYEMAYRMQTAVPELADLTHEPDHIIKMYGADCLSPGTYASNCLLARKLSESGVRFVQLYHQGWDQHDNMVGDMPLQAGRTSGTCLRTKSTRGGKKCRGRWKPASRRRRAARRGGAVG